MAGNNKNIQYRVFCKPSLHAGQPCYACTFFSFVQKCNYYPTFKDFNKQAPA